MNDTASVLVGLDGCAMKRFEVSPDGKYIAFFGRYGNIHVLTARVWYKLLLLFTSCFFTYFSWRVY